MSTEPEDRATIRRQLQDSRYSDNWTAWRTYCGLLLDDNDALRAERDEPAKLIREAVAMLTTQEMYDPWPWVAAAQLWLASLDSSISPKPCPECAGNGQVLTKVQATDGLGNAHEHVIGTAKCSVCSGCGRAPAPDLVGE